MKNPEEWDTYMVTVPRERMTLRQILKMFKIQNAEKWIVGKEKGKNGYKHWQIRYKRAESTRPIRQINDWASYGGHVEIARTDDWSYEAKTGNYLCSWERDISFLKHGALRGKQIDVKHLFEASGVPRKGEAESRKVVVWVNKAGRHGKTYLVKWLLANHKAVYVPPQMKTALSMIRWTYWYPSDAYIIDLPRDAKNTVELWSAIETIKDGYSFDERFSNHFRLNPSPRVLVLTNKTPPKTLLSDDRWEIIET